MHVDCWIQQVTTRVGAVTCWIQQPVSPKQVVGFSCLPNSEVDQLITYCLLDRVIFIETQNRTTRYVSSSFGCVLFSVLRARRFVMCKQSIPCVPGKTFPVLQARLFLCSLQNISCLLSKTFLVSHAGNSRVPSTTLRHSQTGNLVTTRKSKV